MGTLKMLSMREFAPTAGPYNGQIISGKGKCKHRAGWLHLRRAKVLVVFCVTAENSLIFPSLDSVEWDQSASLSEGHQAVRT